MIEKDLQELSLLCKETAGEAYFYGMTSTHELMSKAAIVFDLLADKIKEKENKTIVYEVEIYDSRERMYGKGSSMKRYFSTREKAEKYIENFYNEEDLERDMSARIHEIEVK